MTWDSFIKSKFATVALAAVLILMMLFAGRAVVQKYQVDKEIAKLNAQVAKVKKNNEDLSYLIKYFNTPEYQEQQAREKLNLKKDGEYVVVLPDTNGAVSGAQGSAANKSNARQWFDYFFGK